MNSPAPSHLADLNRFSFGYDAEELRAVFGELTKSMSNWKLPIDQCVEADRLAISCAALSFMVGGTVEVAVDMPGTFRVRSAGYYANIGA